MHSVAVLETAAVGGFAQASIDRLDLNKINNAGEHDVSVKNRFPLRVLCITVLGILLLNIVAASTAYARHPRKPPRDVFSLGPTGLGLVKGDVLVATRLTNNTRSEILNIQIESITLNAADTLVSLPILLGKIDAGQNAVVEATFSAAGLTPGVRYSLEVHGKYLPPDNRPSVDDKSDEHKGRRFSVLTELVLPPAAPGSGVVQTRNAPAQTVSGGRFPPVKMPDNFDEANDAGPPVPTGPFVPVKPAGGTVPKPDPGDPAVNFAANDPLGLTSGGSNGTASSTAEPSGAANGGGVVFVTANWIAAYSTNGGTSFTQLDPTTIFPADAVGFCCDQIAQYVPSIDRFIWLLQGNGYRIASASPLSVENSGATSWTYWTLTPGFFGLTGALDYPDMSVGDNFLYLSFDEIGTGLMVVRIPLSEIQAGGTVTVEWTDPANGGPAYGSHVTQDTGAEVFWAGHNNTSQMRVFSLAEGSGTYFWRDINIGSWSNTGLSSTTPDGNDFLTKLQNFPGNAVLGGTRAPGPVSSDQRPTDGIWFAWSAGTDTNFAQPHVEMVTLDRGNNFAVLQQVQVWNAAYTFAYPALATNACTGEVGFSLEGGGGGNYENHLVGFWGDFVAYTTTNSNIGTTRFGDYVTIRQDPSPALNGAYFDTFGYGLNSPSASQSGPQTDVRYVQFGRAGACQINLK